MIEKPPEIGCESMGRVTGVEPATSRITISPENNKFKRFFRLLAENCQRETAGLRAAVEKTGAPIPRLEELTKENQVMRTTLTAIASLTAMTADEIRSLAKATLEALEKP